VASSIDTSRLLLEPRRVEDPDEMAGLLDDASLHRYTGGRPETCEELRVRYARQVAGASRGWPNWIVRQRDTSAIVGTVHATLFDDHGRGAAELSWIVISSQQGKGYAREAAAGMVAWLREHGVESFVAHVHPEHAASIAVARGLGMTPGASRGDGEVRWATGG
jgi:RimJ/RimL family protein N-acetyltransferase